MANHASALKRHRQSTRRRAVNRMNRNRLKTEIKKLKTVIESGKSVEAKALLTKTIGVIDKSVQKGVLAKNAAGRYKSTLSKKVNALPAA